MRIPCPLCGSRDIREFTYRGHALGIERPAADAGDDAWDDFVFFRENPAGPMRDLWFHGQGCAAWLVVSRDTVSHEVTGAELVRDAKRGTV